jgi:4-hydroxy-tetrahydrodipicolinate reductase
MGIAIVGNGPLGRAIAAALRERGDGALVLGRPRAGRHDPSAFHGCGAAVEASRGPAVASNVSAAIEGGVRLFVIATTAWESDRAAVEAQVDAAGVVAVVAPNLSVGMSLFGRLIDSAVAILGPVATFDPYLVEWHRRGKKDRPSGTARALAGRIVRGHPRLATIAESPAASSSPAALEVVGVRAGSNPGSHLVGFDGCGETIELRHLTRDRSAYVAGALAALDWLLAARRAPGIHSFDVVVDDLLARSPAGETVMVES